MDALTLDKRYKRLWMHKEAQGRPTVKPMISLDAVSRETSPIASRVGSHNILISHQIGAGSRTFPAQTIELTRYIRFPVKDQAI